MRVFDVELHGKVVGALRESANGHIEFRFNELYRAARPRYVLGQAFIDDPNRVYVGKQRELPPFFANLVPEGELRPFLETHLNIVKGDDLGLLEVVGRDLPGAVEVRRMAGDQDDIDDFPAQESPVSPREFSATEEELRFSLAGVQLKFSVVRAAEKITLPVSGGRGDQILKLDSERFPGVVENEYTMMRWAHRAGFDVPPCELVPTSVLAGRLMRYTEDEVNALLIGRYDRGVERIHQEDFAQVLNARPVNKYGNLSYEALAHLVRAIVGPAGCDEVIQRLVFMIASGNADAHLKNWSLVYPDRITARLSPLYDQVCTVAWPEVRAALALKLVGVRRFEDVKRSTFEHLADTLSLPRQHVTNLVDGTLDRIRSAWAELQPSAEWRMLETHTTALREHWKRVPLLAERGPL